MLEEKATQIHQQSERVTELEAERSALDSRLTALTAKHDELATGNQVLASERDSLYSDLSAKSTLLEVLTQGRIAQDGQMETLLGENKKLATSRDALELRVTELEREVEQLRDRAKLLDEEFGKAEGQLDLIKDIFLREAIR